MKPEKLSKAEIARRIEANQQERSELDGLVRKDPQLQVIRDKIQTLHKELDELRDKKYGKQYEANTRAYGFLRVDLRTASRLPQAPELVRRALDKLTSGVTARVHATEWSHDERFVIAHKKGKSEYINRGQGNAYSPARWYLLDLDAIEDRVGGWSCMWVLGGDQAKYPFLVDHVEGRISAEKLAEWRKKLKP